MRNILFILSAFMLFACKDDDNEKTGDSIIGEWQAEKIVSRGVDIPIDNCSKQTRIIITNSRFTYYKYWKNGSDCNSEIDDYNYIITAGEKDNIKKQGETLHYYTCTLENGGSRLRVVYLNNTYGVFKRK